MSEPQANPKHPTRALLEALRDAAHEGTDVRAVWGDHLPWTWSFTPDRVVADYVARTDPLFGALLAGDLGAAKAAVDVMGIPAFLRWLPGWPEPRNTAAAVWLTTTILSVFGPGLGHRICASDYSLEALSLLVGDVAKVKISALGGTAWAIQQRMSWAPLLVLDLMPGFAEVCTNLDQGAGGGYRSRLCLQSLNTRSFGVFLDDAERRLRSLEQSAHIDPKVVAARIPRVELLISILKGET